jgi:MFS transporter, PAT family, solute carrier family 33 (acetyl-CoA transportor), member 1
MSYRQRKPQSRSPVPRQPEELEGLPRTAVSTPAISTTLDSVQITPRNPHTMRQNHVDAEEEVELSLLEEDDRRQAAAGFVDGNGHLEAKHKAPLSAEDKRAMTLLCVLCT